MKNIYQISKGIFLIGASLVTLAQTAAFDLSNASFSMSYNGGNAVPYYGNANLIGVNSAYVGQVNNCLPLNNYYNQGSFRSPYANYNTAPYVSYPSSFPSYMPPQMPMMPMLPMTGMNNTAGRPIIAPFTNNATFVPPHLIAASYYNAPNFVPPPPACTAACGGALMQAAPIIPVAGGPLLDNAWSGTRVFQSNAGSVVDLRTDVNFSSNLWPVAKVFSDNAPNVYSAPVFQQPPQLNVGPYQTGSRDYTIDSRSPLVSH